MSRLLLLSNSTNPGEPYLGWSSPHIKDFLGSNVKNVLFIPYAGVTFSHDEYQVAVGGAFEKLGYTVTGIHQKTISSSLLSEFDAIAVGGGNTFQLIHQLQSNDLIDKIKEAVEGGMPYIGWSAGSNVACPTIKTTNDMPITEPESFNAINLVPFQLNPHYTEATIPNHGGESRDMRIKEFVTANQDMYVAGLPEGSLLRKEGDRLYFAGKGECKIFHYETETQLFKDGDDLSWLLTSN